MEDLLLPLFVVLFVLLLLLLLLLLLYELGSAMLDPRSSEVPSRAGGAALDRCELCVVGVLVLALAIDPDPTTDADVLDPALVVRSLPLASSGEGTDCDVAGSSESSVDPLDLLDPADSVVSPPSVPVEENHDDAGPEKSPSDLLDPAVAAALLRSTSTGEDVSRTVMVLLESLSTTEIVLLGSLSTTEIVLSGSSS
jgi:hypothetical protein